MKRILVVDDERKMRRLLQMMLAQMDFESVATETAEEALRLADAEHFDLMLTDLRLPEMNGLELLRRMRQSVPTLPVIVLTAFGTIESAVEAMKLGAFDYVVKPFDIDALGQIVRNALQLQQFALENRYLRERIERAEHPEFVVAESTAMREVLAVVERVAATPTTVLITGETGAGKDVVAQLIHGASARRQRLFVPVNCAAIPHDLLESELFGHERGAFTGAQAAREGKFELADGGTLFLDEIGDMPYALQAKLLRVLQDSTIERVGSNKRIRVDVRVVSSTNSDLVGAVADGRFRQDLFYRLNVVQVAVPPLRERVPDILPLAEGFLARYARQFGRPNVRLAPDAVEALRAYRWPGNVRELQNVMERATVLTPTGGAIDARTLGVTQPTVEPEVVRDLRLGPAVDGVERKVILRALAATAGNKTEAASVLGISERTLWYKLKKHGL